MEPRVSYSKTKIPATNCYAMGWSVYLIGACLSQKC